MADVFKAGGTAGQGAYIALDDAGQVSVSDGTTVASLSRSVLTTLVTAAGYFGGLVLDYSGISTGTAYVSVKANLAAAWLVKQGSTAMATFVTTTSKWRLKLGSGTLLQFGPSVVISISANHTLVFGTAGANQTALTSNIVFVTNTSGSSKNVILPALTDLADVPLFIFAASGDIVVKQADGTTTICTILSGKAAMISTDGASVGGAILGS